MLARLVDCELADELAIEAVDAAGLSDGRVNGPKPVWRRPTNPWSPPLLQPYSEPNSSLFRRCSDAVPTLFRHCFEPIPTLFEWWPIHLSTYESGLATPAFRHRGEHWVVLSKGPFEYDAQASESRYLVDARACDSCMYRVLGMSSTSNTRFFSLPSFPPNFNLSRVCEVEFAGVEVGVVGVLEDDVVDLGREIGHRAGGFLGLAGRVEESLAVEVDRCLEGVRDETDVDALRHGCRPRAGILGRRTARGSNSFRRSASSANHVVADDHVEPIAKPSAEMR